MEHKMQKKKFSLLKFTKNLYINSCYWQTLVLHELRESVLIYVHEQEKTDISYPVKTLFSSQDHRIKARSTP